MISFLDLPYAVRRRVYIMAGLVRVCPVNMNTENLDKTAFVQRCFQWAFDMELDDFDTSYFQTVSRRRCRYQSQLFGIWCPLLNDDGLDCMCPRLPMALLRVCRSVQEEVFKILYSENRFQISRSGRRGLTPLLQLSPRAVAHLRVLSIRLNNCCCTRIEPCKMEIMYADESFCKSCHFGCHGGKDTPLQLPYQASTSPSSQPDSLSTWKDVIRHLAENALPGKLHLGVTCDCADETTASRIAKTLLDLPRLAACDIRLGQRPSTAQGDIARRTALALVGCCWSQQPFPFLRLPVEVQMRVLSYTPLLHADGVAYWSPLTNPARADCCKACSGTLDACCCYVLHGAFSTIDTCCSSWITPVSLLLVNNRFYELGMEILFSKNVFHICWWTDGSGQEDDRHQSLLMLLTRFPEAAYRYIRKIHVCLQGLGYSNIDPGYKIAENGYCFGVEWLESIALMSTKLVMPRLTLWIEDLSYRGRSQYNLETDVDDSLQVEEKEWTLYQRLVEPIADLGEQPLRDLALEFSEPPYQQHDDLRMERRKELEKSIMGQGYCSDDVSGLRQQFGRRPKARRALFEPLHERSL